MEIVFFLEAFLTCRLVKNNRIFALLENENAIEGTLSPLFLY